jgi:hypothetical protein
VSEEEKEAIEKLKKDSEILKLELIGFTIKSRNKLANNIEIAVNYIDKLQKELDKKDETIDVMSEFLCGIDLVDELGQDSWNWNKKQMKEYFYKKVEEKYE